MTAKRKIKFSQIKTRTTRLCLIEGKLNSLTERKLNSLKSGEVVQVVGLGGVDKEQSGLSEKAQTLHLECIMNSLLAKVQTFWSCLIRRKFNSLKRGEVVQVVVTDGVVGLGRVDEEQVGPQKQVARLFR